MIEFGIAIFATTEISIKKKRDFIGNKIY